MNAWRWNHRYVSIKVKTVANWTLFLRTNVMETLHGSSTHKNTMRLSCQIQIKQLCWIMKEDCHTSTLGSPPFLHLPTERWKTLLVSGNLALIFNPVMPCYQALKKPRFMRYLLRKNISSLECNETSWYFGCGAQSKTNKQTNSRKTQQQCLLTQLVIYILLPHKLHRLLCNFHHHNILSSSFLPTHSRTI